MARSRRSGRARGGRPPKPTVLHKIEGTFQPSRHAERSIESKTEGDLALKSVPEWLSESQRALWADILLDAPKEVLRRIDWVLFCNYIELVDRHAHLVQAQRRLNEGEPWPFLIKGQHGLALSPYLRAINHCVLLMTRLQGEMGFTPASRAGLVVPWPDEDDIDPGWDELRSLRVFDGGKGDGSKK